MQCNVSKCDFSSQFITPMPGGISMCCELVSPSPPPVPLATAEAATQPAIAPS